MIKQFLKRFYPLVKLHRDLQYFGSFLCNRFFYMITLKKRYRKISGEILNIKNPVTYNEKIQWLKIHYRDPLMTQCADKYRVRKYVENKIGSKYLIELYGIYQNPKNINFAKLPKDFVIKPNHSSGKVLICNDKSKLNWAEEQFKIKNWLSRNFFYQCGEWVYKDIKPLLLCEKLLPGELMDYKFFCFHGKPEFIMICSDREHELKLDFYDMQWKKMSLSSRPYPHSDIPIEQPQCFLEMMELAKKLSADFPHVRVDLYQVDGKIYFGELTFFPGNGMEIFEPRSFNEKIGSLINLQKLDRSKLIHMK